MQSGKHRVYWNQKHAPERQRRLELLKRKKGIYLSCFEWNVIGTDSYSYTIYTWLVARARLGRKSISVHSNLQQTPWLLAEFSNSENLRQETRCTSPKFSMSSWLHSKYSFSNIYSILFLHYCKLRTLFCYFNFLLKIRVYLQGREIKVILRKRFLKLLMTLVFRGCLL